MPLLEIDFGTKNASRNANFLFVGSILPEFEAFFAIILGINFS